jgi:omega-6 fatty acid desaturase (delta-12 desaturase)
VQLPITLLAASIGVWLFYVQHQFEGTFWTHDEGWNFHDAGLHGSSHYNLPRILRWFTADIGVHHVHHLCSRIPYYRLQQVLRDHPQLAAVGRFTLFQSLRCVPKVLWDERRCKLISFRETETAHLTLPWEPKQNPLHIVTDRRDDDVDPVNRRTDRGPSSPRD